MVSNHYKNILEPTVLQENLIVISLFIATFEFVKDTIISRPKDFFMLGFENDEYIISPEYKKTVLSRNNSPLYASLDWFKDHSAIDQRDIDTFTRIKTIRNEAVHEMMSLISEGPSAIHEEAFNSLRALLVKIERWWFSEIELPINPDYDENEIDINSVLPGKALLIDILQEVALGDEDERIKHLEVFLKHET